MKYCTKCGSENTTDACFCARCGHCLDATQCQSTTPTPQTQQSQTGYNQPYEQMPSTYLWLSILVTFFCCLPLGIPAIIFASQVESRFRQGDYAGAVSSSNKAKNFCIGSIVAGIIFFTCYILFILLIVGIENADSHVTSFSSWDD